MRKRLPFRNWYYFRTGYSTYVALILGIVNTLTTTYYLAIRNIPSLNDVFPNFAIYIILITGIGLPVTIITGYLHFKRSSGYSSEIDIAVESNPYYYKLPPGFWKEVFAPLYLEVLRLSMKVAKNEKVEEEDLKRFKEIEDKIIRLIHGESIR